jgi:hypothetical protein
MPKPPHSRTPSGRGPARQARRGALPLTALALLTAVAATACSVEPGGADLGTDWKGAKAFALAEVGGELTVVGVNPKKGKAEALAVVPSQADDNDTLAPQIARLADGRWVLSVPRKGGKPDRLYGLDRKEHAVSGHSAGVEPLHGLYPAKSLVAAVPGLPDEGKGGGELKGDSSAVLVEKPGNWQTTRTVKIPGTVSLAASAPTSDTLCLTQDAKDGGGPTRVTTVDLASGRTHEETAAPDGFEVQQLACADGRPVLAGPAKTGGGTSKGSGKLSVSHKGGTTQVTVDGGRIDQLAADGDTITAAVFHKDTESLVTLDAKSGKETHRATLPGLSDADGMQHTDQGWLVFSDDTAALVAPSAPTAKKITLPGKILAS